MDKIKKALGEAYKRFVPSDKDRAKLNRIADKFISVLNDNARKNQSTVEFKFSGSYAKGTWIKNESDIDILAVFESENDIKTLSYLVPKNFTAVFGTRKYFRGRVSGITVEVVPVLRFSDIKKVNNSVDLSVLHANYINSVLSDPQKNDVILLKALCKANNCYGSETYMHGFSGYSLEVLISEFRDLLSLIEAVKSWKEPVNLGKSKDTKNYPIFLPDPTNYSRNICASVGGENLSRFIFALKSFLIFPSINSFIKKSIKDRISAEVKARGTKLFSFTTKIIEPKDIFLSKYVKNAGKLIDELGRNDVEIYSVDFDYGEKSASIFLQIKNTPKTRTKLVYGPLVSSDIEIIRSFIHAHKNVFLSGVHLSYDKNYNVKNFNKFILVKIKEYMSPKSVLMN